MYPFAYFLRMDGNSTPLLRLSLRIIQRRGGGKSVYRNNKNTTATATTYDYISLTLIWTRGIYNT